jgi:hypothetical protein
MKKLYTFLLASLSCLAVAQTTATIVASNFNGDPVKDLDGNNFYYHSFNQTSKTYTLKKVDNTNTTTTVLTTTVNAAGLASVNTINVGTRVNIKNNKTIIAMPRTIASPGKYIFLLINGTAVDTFSTNEVQTIFGLDFIKKPNAGYFNDQQHIYKTTNYTAASTTTLLTFPGASTAPNGFIRDLYENNDILYYTYSNISASKFYLCKVVNGVNTKVDSGGIGYRLFQNKLTNEVFAQKNNIISYSIIRFDVNGNAITIPTPPNSWVLYTITNNKLIYATASSVGLIAQDLNTLTASTITAVSSLTSITQNFVTNGTDCYFLTGTSGTALLPWYTNGISATQIGTPIEFNNNQVLLGDFCGSNYLTKGYVLVSSSYPDRLYNLTPTASALYYPNGNTNYISCTTPVTTNFGMFSNLAGLTPSFTNDLYKISCASVNGINELNTSAIFYKLYPNPTTADLNIELEVFDKPTTVTVSNVLGKVVLTEFITTQNSKLSTQNLNAGVYFLQVGNSKAVKFIKR